MNRSAKKCATFIMPLIASAMLVSASLRAESDSSVSLAPLQAHTIEMRDFTAVVYYVELDDGLFDIVTTIGPNGDTDSPTTQQRTSLSIGQSYKLSLDQGDGTALAVAIEFKATEDNKLAVLY
ncbi:MAG: hypothetical protein KTR32_11320 [Granulosicoccus sp.]|nr:hypothetical protein [Granulosicoccus sp.]